MATSYLSNRKTQTILLLGGGGGGRECTVCSSYLSAYISRVQNTNPPTSPLDVCDCIVVFIPRECAAVVLELKNLPRPRSPSFTTAEAVTNTLAGLISKHGRICMCECVYVSVSMCECVCIWVGACVFEYECECLGGGGVSIPRCMTLLECMCSRALQSWTKYLLCVEKLKTEQSKINNICVIKLTHNIELTRWSFLGSVASFS